MHPLTYEQAIYGSFAFREGGYALLSHSPNCKPEWLAAFATACQKFGEPPGWVAFSRAIFSLPIDKKKGPWLIVAASPTGQDDRGRPGALGFHGLFIEEREFGKIGFDPFRLTGELRSDWADEAASSSRAGYCRPSSSTEMAGNSRPYEEAAKLSSRLLQGRRVAIESPSPIEDFARQVWSGLPEKVRRKTSMATWAFANGNHFDLVAVPRLEAIEWDESYAEPPRRVGGVSLLSPEKPIEKPPEREKKTGGSRPPLAGILAVVALIAAIVVSWMVAVREREISPRRGPVSIPSPSSPVGPDRASYRDAVPDPAEVREVAQGLAEFAGRFGIPLDGNPPDPTSAMVRLADRLRYRGTILSEEERSNLAKEKSPGRSRAMAWDSHVRLFLADRRLPDGFENGPLRWKLDQFAWTFHVEPNPRLSTSEIPRALADSLAIDEPSGPNPLAARYPALGEYARFLARLPRR